MDVKSEPVVRIDCKQGLIRSIRFNADGQYAMTCGSDRTIKLWRPSKLLQLKCYRGHSADVVDCQANKDSSQFISCSNDRSIIAWDVESGKINRRFRNLAPFNSVCYGHEATTALACSVDGTVRVYDLRALNAKDPIQSLTEASDSVTCCKVYKHFIFTTSLDKNLRTYDIRKGCMSVDTLHMSLNYISVGQDGRTLLVNCLRGPSILVDRVEGKILNQYGGNENKLFKIESTFVLSDSGIAAGSEDGKVYIWDTTSQTPKAAFQHNNVQPPVIQSISSDSLDYLLTSCSNFMFMWSLY